MSEAVGVRRVSAASYGAMQADFADLCRRAEAPNLHMAPAAIAAALPGRVKQANDIVILCAEGSGSGLLGVWAFRRMRNVHTGFAAMLQSPLVPLYEVSSAPVLDRDRAGPVALALLRFIADAGDLPKILRLPLLPVEGVAFAALQAACAGTGSTLHRFESWARPMAIPAAGDDAQTYLRRALGHSYKKRLQQHRLLERAGTLQLARHRGAEVAAALERFLSLEAAGWKGRNGTALAKLPADAAYFRETVARFAEADMARIDLLLLDDAPIAAGVLVDFAGQAHFLKIAYDERLARLSPGRGLAIEMLRADFAAGPGEGLPFRLDSGAGDRVDPGAYPWGERQAMAHAIVEIGGAGSALPRLAARGRMLLRQWRDRARN
ncbi:GNAT family N-acetyltransferase [Bosea sp. (in: a-proteobacteria)]|uniref:GNAT family N-acetyltransferase n=1 Tax=Bosea sp. (in: a-proteobacteria) TaxID=1871050 RepID=UPI002FC6B7DA